MFNDKQKSEFEQVYGDLITQFGADEVKAILDGLTTADWSKYYFDNGYYVEDENNRAYKLDDKGREIDVHTWWFSPPGLSLAKANLSLADRRKVIASIST